MLVAFLESVLLLDLDPNRTFRILDFASECVGCPLEGVERKCTGIHSAVLAAISFLFCVVNHDIWLDRSCFLEIVTEVLLGMRTEFKAHALCDVGFEGKGHRPPIVYPS